MYRLTIRDTESHLPFMDELTCDRLTLLPLFVELGFQVELDVSQGVQQTSGAVRPA
jgi:hypothetical protein